MTNTNKLGICMDHSSAHLIEFTTEPMTTTSVSSGFTHQEKEDSISKSESLMHHKEQHELNAYYKHLGGIIKHYDGVLLFGPTNARVELFNLLKNDHAFDNIKIEVSATDKMTENQQHAFVRDHFSKHPSVPAL